MNAKHSLLIVLASALISIACSAPASAPKSPTTYAEALASAETSGACYIEATPEGWIVVQDCDAADQSSK